MIENKTSRIDRLLAFIDRHPWVSFHIFLWMIGIPLIYEGVQCDNLFCLKYVGKNDTLCEHHSELRSQKRREEYLARVKKAEEEESKYWEEHPNEYADYRHEQLEASIMAEKRRRYSSYYASDNNVKKPKKTYISGPGYYSNRTYTSSYDPYDVQDYDDPDDFADEWEGEFDDYDDAYDYWEENY